MNQEMIAQQEKLQVEVCYALKKHVNHFMYLKLVEAGLPPSRDDAKFMEMLTNSYANYCKR